MRLPREAVPLVLLLLGVLAAPRLAAQQPSTTPVGSAQALPTPVPDLGLSSAQEASLRAITSATQGKQRAILARQVAGNPLSHADHEALTAIARAHNAAVQAVLTPAQQAQLDLRRMAVETAQRARGRTPRGAR